MISNSDRFGGDSYLFGDGSDGTVVISSNTTLVEGIIKQYKNLTINSGVFLRGATNTIFAIRVNGVLTVNGTLGMGGNGVAGGTADNGGIGEFTTDMDFVAIASGGSGAGAGGDKAGGDGIAGGGGTRETSGTASGGQAASTPLLYLNALPSIITRTKEIFGGGGGGGSTAGPGIGGKGGGYCIVFAKNIVIGASGALSAAGAGGVSDDRAGGGGGGFLALVYSTLTNAGSNNIHANGGDGKYSGGTVAGAGGTALMNEIPTDGADTTQNYAGAGGGGGMCVGIQI
jgi:hypothetical protein